MKNLSVPDRDNNNILCKKGINVIHLEITPSVGPQDDSRPLLFSHKFGRAHASEMVKLFFMGSETILQHAFANSFIKWYLRYSCITCII